MAGYCGSCGTPLTGPFCGACGKPSNQPQAPVQPAAAVPSPALQPQTPAPMPAPKSGSGLGKVLLILALIFGVFAVLGIGAVFYGVHWAKKKVAGYSDRITTGNGEQVVVSRGNSCELLPKEELQQILGVSIEKSEEIEEANNPGCAYFTNPDGFTQLKKMAVEQVRRDSARASQRSAPKTDNPLELLKDTKDLEGVVKSLGLQEPAKDGQIFSFTVDRKAGSESWTGMKTAMAAVPGFEEVLGVGDHAMIGSFGHAFYAMKGSTMIQLTTIYVPDAQALGADIARRILSRL